MLGEGVVVAVDKRDSVRRAIDEAWSTLLANSRFVVAIGIEFVVVT